MDAVTLYQPWASLVAMGYRSVFCWSVERCRQLVGKRIAIHASTMLDPDAEALISRIAGNWPAKRLPREALCWLGGKPELPINAVLCTAMAVEATELDEASEHLALVETAGRYGVFLAEIELVDPPAFSYGARGIWGWHSEDEK